MLQDSVRKHSGDSAEGGISNDVVIAGQFAHDYIRAERLPARKRAPPDDAEGDQQNLAAKARSPMH
jgi:hypothetical protein